MKNSEPVPTNDSPAPESGRSRFGQFVLDTRKRTLSRGDSPVFLTPKAFDVLIFLVQNPNRLVTKEELLQAVWGNTFVEEGNLTQYISHLRKALGDNSEDTRLIVTIARKGYQFTANVVAVAELGDISKRTDVRIPTTEGRQTDISPVEFPAEEAAPKVQKPWRRAAVVAVSAVILVGVAYISWRHFRAITPPKSERILLAVLPFQNLTGDPNKEYLADGLTEETISQLSRLNPERLGVISRTSVMGYKHKDERPDQIGRDLSVQYLLENSIRESGNHIRLTAQLIQVKDQTHLWSQEYDYPAMDILNIEEDVAKAVAREIQLRLTSKQQAELAQAHPVNPAAFDAYLQGYFFFERNTNKDTDMAAKYFERATQLDPSYALAWAWLSRARNWQAEEGLVPRQEGRSLSREAIERAIALDPNLAEAYSQMGRLKFVDFDWGGGDDSIRRAIALEPGNPEYLDQAAFSAAKFGRSDEALVLARRAVELDPLNAFSWGTRGEIEYYEGQLAGAEADVKKSLELSPDVWPGPFLLSEIYLTQGRPQDALPEIKLVRSDYLRTYLYALAYAAIGQQEQSDTALKELIAKYSTRRAFFVASVYAFRNQRDEAFEWLDRAYVQREDDLGDTNFWPMLQSLRSDPRFAEFLKKLNLPA
jgi:TolB-like protein/DNA-binding winged helix-turn-helix (wHTH) protein/Tfp pilus assembly protein PilF